MLVGFSDLVGAGGGLQLGAADRVPASPAENMREKKGATSPQLPVEAAGAALVADLHLAVGVGRGHAGRPLLRLAGVAQLAGRALARGGNESILTSVCTLLGGMTLPSLSVQHWLATESSSHHSWGQLNVRSQAGLHLVLGAVPVVAGPRLADVLHAALTGYVRLVQGVTKS